MFRVGEQIDRLTAADRRRHRGRRRRPVGLAGARGRVARGIRRRFVSSVGGLRTSITSIGDGRRGLRIIGVASLDEDGRRDAAGEEK